MINLYNNYILYMKGGYVSCVSNKWQPLNPGEKYNDLEARGLNKLGICFDGNGTDKYNLDGLKKWYFKNNKTNLYKLGEIVEELKKNALKYKTTEAKFREGYNLLFDSYNMREKKSYIYESRDGRTEKTKGHINYYNDLNDFVSILDNIIKYIDEHKEIIARFKRRKSIRRNSRSRSNRSSSSISSRSNRSRGKNKKTKKKKN
jgi:hypothetical protein